MRWDAGSSPLRHQPAVTHAVPSSTRKPPLAAATAGEVYRQSLVFNCRCDPRAHTVSELPGRKIDVDSRQRRRRRQDRHRLVRVCPTALTCWRGGLAGCRPALFSWRGAMRLVVAVATRPSPPEHSLPAPAKMDRRLRPVPDGCRVVPANFSQLRHDGWARDLSGRPGTGSTYRSGKVAV